MRHTVYYDLLVPTQTGEWPVLIVLHGYGQSSKEFLEPFFPLAERGILVAAPQAPNQFYPDLRERRVGFTWLTSFQRDQSIQDFLDYMQQFYESLGNRFPVVDRPIYLLGFSQGVSMAYRIWCHGALPVRGLVAIGADLPPDVIPLLGRQTPIPILLCHSTQDPRVPFEKALEAEKVLKQHSFPARLIRFKGDHRVPSGALEDIRKLIEEE